MPVTWTPEAKEFALALVRGGASSSEISRRVYHEFKIYKSRNAVIGLAHRAKLSLHGRAPNGRTPRPKRNGAYRAPQPPKPQSPIRAIIADGLPLPPPHETDVARVRSLDLERHHCRYICTPEPQGPFVPQFCGLEVVPGLSWCPSHAMRCFDLSRPPMRMPNTGTGAGAAFERASQREQEAKVHA